MDRQNKLSYNYRMNSLPIIYSDDEICIINKPAGLAVQGGAGIVHSVDRLLPSQTGQPVYLVHRLDKDTAGILVTAKTPAAATKWTKAAAGSDMVKEYRAVCIGTAQLKKGIIDEPVVRGGVEKSARTRFTVLDEYTDKDSGMSFSLVSLQLDTGRMHQIRIHLASAGLPIAADDKYGNFQLNKKIKTLYGMKRLHLAAVKLTVSVNGVRKAFEVPLPPHMIFPPSAKK